MAVNRQGRAFSRMSVDMWHPICTELLIDSVVNIFSPDRYTANADAVSNLLAMKQDAPALYAALKDCVSDALGTTAVRTYPAWRSLMCSALESISLIISPEEEKEFLTGNAQLAQTAYHVKLPPGQPLLVCLVHIVNVHVVETMHTSYAGYEIVAAVKIYKRAVDAMHSLSDKQLGWVIRENFAHFGEEHVRYAKTAAYLKVMATCQWFNGWLYWADMHLQHALIGTRVDTIFGQFAIPIHRWQMAIVLRSLKTLHMWVKLGVLGWFGGWLLHEEKQFIFDSLINHDLEADPRVLLHM